MSWCRKPCGRFLCGFIFWKYIDFMNLVRSKFASIINQSDSIWDRFSFDFESWEAPGWLWSPRGRPRLNFDRFQIDFGTSRGTKSAPTWRPWGDLWRLGASSGGLWTIVNPFIFDFISDPISDFILHRFRTPKRCKNHSKIDQKVMPKSRRKKGLFPYLCHRNFKRL